jgi:uncharacterized membrane protein
MARRRDLGITEEFEQSVADRLEPGRSAAVVLVDESHAPGIETAAQNRGAWTRTVTLVDADATTPAE